eukprot:107736-Pyramimonas_sp.AAC.1
MAIAKIAGTYLHSVPVLNEAKVRGQCHCILDVISAYIPTSQQRFRERPQQPELQPPDTGAKSRSFGASSSPRK